MASELTPDQRALIDELEPIWFEDRSDPRIHEAAATRRRGVRPAVWYSNTNEKVVKLTARPPEGARS